MSTTKTTLTLLIALVATLWGWDAYTSIAPADAHPLWLARQHGLILSGYLSIALMSLAMLLATRPAWLEGPFGGMDRVYRTHKWAGILGIAFAALHWLIEMSSSPIKSLIGRAGRVPKEKFTGLLEAMRDLAEDMGEWAIYAVLIMLAITLWRRVPYRVWRFLHRAMPVLYLMLGFHAALLAPQHFWTQPVGALLGLLLAAGAYGALRALLGNIGRARQVSGEIVEVTQGTADITTVRCRLARGWSGHRPGQFAFVTFEAKEGAHPFTIASADHGNQEVTFQIKSLGDYTRQLGERLRVGQPVRVEGPYGRFDLGRRNPHARQIWIAGGIGVTPFLAWLESLQAAPGEAPVADVHYCVRDRQTDALLPRLEALCAGLPGIRLQVHCARQGDLLDAGSLGEVDKAEIWFCGPAGLAGALRRGLQAMPGQARFHQEAFEMR